MTVEFIPIARPVIGDEERTAVDRVLRSGMLVQGAEVAAFEAEFSETFGLRRRCVAVNSGTSGLHLSLLAAGVGPGDEVIVPSFTFAATANAVRLTGATPVFADIDPETYCVDPQSVEDSVTERTVALMPVHLYGHPADMPALQQIADRHGLQIIEDAAQAHGASLHEVPVGAFGSFAIFSLYATKNMTSGEGGMIVVSEAELDRLLRLYRNQGMEQPYANEIVGFNNRMTDIHAAIGRVQLSRVKDLNEKRRSNAAYLTDNLRGVTPPAVAPGAHHVFHQYTIRVPEDRDGFARALREEHGIGTGMFYPKPVHRLSPFAVSPGRVKDLPETDRAARECLSLPVHPALGCGDLERIVTAVNQVARAGSRP